MENFEIILSQELRKLNRKEVALIVRDRLSKARVYLEEAFDFLDLLGPKKTCR